MLLSWFISVSLRGMFHRKVFLNYSAFSVPHENMVEPNSENKDVSSILILFIAPF